MQKINEMLEGVEKEMGIGQCGDWFKIAEGDNRVRILTELTPYVSHYKVGACLGKADCPTCKEDPDAKPTVKFLCHLIDRKDNIIKLAQLPYSVAKSIGDYQDDPDYSFASAPMPYDVNIKAKGAGTKEVVYTVIASPKRDNVTDETIDKLKTKKTPVQVKERMIEKRREVLGLKSPNMVGGLSVEYPTESIHPDDIKF